MKRSHILLAVVSPFLLVSIVLAYPFYLLYRLVDENGKTSEFVQG